MLDPVFQFFEKLVSDFSWKRLALVLSIVGVIIGVAYIYESQTGHFELQRIEKEIALLSDLIDLSNKISSNPDHDIQAAISNLKAQLRKSTGHNEVGLTFSVTYKKIFAAAAAWLVLGVLMSLATRTRSSSSSPGELIVGMLIAAIPFIVLAGFLPTFEATWINYYLYPIGHVVVVVAAIVAWHKRKLKRAAT